MTLEAVGHRYDPQLSLPLRHCENRLSVIIRLVYVTNHPVKMMTSSGMGTEFEHGRQEPVWSNTELRSRL
jgi:hypothetical protein